MRKMLKSLTLAGIVALSCWGYTRPAAAVPMTCPVNIPSCAINGKACTQETICCDFGPSFIVCQCTGGTYHCS